MTTDRTPRWWRYVCYGLLIAAAAISAAFLVAKWAINAEAAGKYDMGIALAAAYGTVIAVYISLLLALVAGLAALGGTFARYRTRWAWLATLIALLPVGYLLVS